MLKFKDVNEGYSFEVYDGEGYMCTISKELKEYIEKIEIQNDKLDAALRMAAIQQYLDSEDEEQINEALGEEYM